MSATKRRVDTLLQVHAAVAAASGAAAFLLPHVFEYFLIPHGESLSVSGGGSSRGNTGDASKIEHLSIRLYGALIAAQAWICWSARRAASAEMRRALVQAYAACFALTAAALLRAQLTPGGGLAAANWLNIAGFAALAAAYGYFALFERIAVFEGLGKV